jgi:hypothetical protein
LINLIIPGDEYKSQYSSLCSFLHPPVTSSPFGPNIHLSALFSNVLSLCSSINLRDHCGQSSWLQTQRSRVRFPALPVGLERGPLSPCEDKWGATWKKSSRSSLENWD